MIKKDIFLLKNELVFVTGNINKLNEVKNILKNFIIKKPCFVEDTSLELNCLNGLPGPYIKYFEKNIGSIGIYKIAKAFSNYEANVCCFVGYQNKKEIKLFKHITKGIIVKPTGKNGFGFDNIFVPKGYEKTFAQMTNEEKNKISHRKKVFEKFLKYLKKN